MGSSHKRAQKFDRQKPLIDVAYLRQLDPQQVRAYLGDGSYGGRYQRSDAELLALWQTGAEETRAVIAEGWADQPE
jgi:creatinine amidohydrolase